SGIAIVDENLNFISLFGAAFVSLPGEKIKTEAFLPKGFFSAIKTEMGFVGDALATSNKNYNFFASVPLTTPDGFTIGSLFILDTTERAMNNAAKKILFDFAAIVMDELELKLSSKKAAKLQNQLLDIATTNDTNVSSQEDEVFAGMPVMEDDISSIRRMSMLIKDPSKEPGQIIDEFFESSIVEGGKMNLKKELVNLSEIAEEVVTENLKKAQNKEQYLKLTIESCPEISGDRQKIKDVVEHLVDNAIKYSPIEGIINVQVIGAEGKAYLEVRDQGQGLSDEDKEMVFNNFAKLSSKPTAGEPSTGIGLPFVKKVVEMHGGRVWAESEGKNLGSSFIIELPKQN
ncbi:MAG: HAMP domain-containing histidine kinase, partial [Bacteroidetes bacterium]|nr:HAMP domain-containing histidine kinase [Bacteroidota bacterium]